MYFLCLKTGQISMGVIDLYTSPSLCLIKTTKIIHRPNWAAKGNNKRVVSMASTIPVEQRVNGGQQRLTGDSFIRPHLRKLSPYQPILPFEVLFNCNPFLFLFFLWWCWSFNASSCNWSFDVFHFVYIIKWIMFRVNNKYGFVWVREKKINHLLFE